MGGIREIIAREVAGKSRHCVKVVAWIERRSLTRRVVTLLDGTRDLREVAAQAREQAGTTGTPREIAQAVERAMGWCCQTGMLEG
jgi:hypothetical protein